MSTKHVLDHAEDAATLLAVMGNTKRLMILCHLLEGELSVGQIAHAVDLSQSALSQHLAKLRRLHIVTTRRDKQTIFYSANRERVEDLILAVDRLYAAADGGRSQARTAAY